MEGRWCTFSLSPVPILDPPVLPKVSHGKTLLPAGDSTSHLIKKIKFIQSDLPRPPSDLFCVSGHPPKNSFAISGRLFSILVSCPLAAGWDTADHLLLDILPLGLHEVFFSAFSSHLTALPGSSSSSHFEM